VAGVQLPLLICHLKNRMTVSTLYLFKICSLTFLAVFHADGAHSHQKLGSTEVLQEVMSQKFYQIKTFFLPGPV